MKIQASGLCHTDLNMQHFLPMPAVVGHEGTGIVEEVGPGVMDVKPGDRAIISGLRAACARTVSLARDISARPSSHCSSAAGDSMGRARARSSEEPISACYFQQSSSQRTPWYRPNRSSWSKMTMCRPRFSRLYPVEP